MGADLTSTRNSGCRNKNEDACFLNGARGKTMSSWKQSLLWSHRNRADQQHRKVLWVRSCSCFVPATVGANTAIHPSQSKAKCEGSTPCSPVKPDSRAPRSDENHHVSVSLLLWAGQNQHFWKGSAQTAPCNRYSFTHPKDGCQEIAQQTSRRTLFCLGQTRACESSWYKSIFLHEQNWTHYCNTAIFQLRLFRCKNKQKKAE